MLGMEKLDGQFREVFILPFFFFFKVFIFQSL